MPLARTASLAAVLALASLPANAEILVTLHAAGAQVYRCSPPVAPQSQGQLVWSFREPIATLMLENKTVGRHYAGPTWEMGDDSLVRARVVETRPGATPDDIPVLVLSTAERSGDGILVRSKTVRRINTKGGVLAGACNSAGELRSVPYEADYVFED
jgi:hypothetical protein